MYFFSTLYMSFNIHHFGFNGVYIMSIFFIFLFWFSQIFFINDILFKNQIYILDIGLIDNFFGTIDFSFYLKIDLLSFSFLFLTTSIGLAAVIYSLTYFKNEPFSDRFILMLNWFILSMSLLVLSDNAILLFLGWELIGLTSFFLINFWTLRRNTLKSAFKAFIFNKISDILLLSFIINLVQITQSASITVWVYYFSILPNLFQNSIFLPVLFLILASSLKSAQIIGHLWLPDSMEAPIPASALIHSATLVSAGIFLLLKFFFLVEYCNLNIFIIFLGTLTSFYGGIVSAAQTDCKKLLAYSTISHCGYLFICVALNNLYLTLIYLYLHGFFKALTFFVIGNFVKISKSYQDIRRMGQLYLVLPIESILLLFCSANLAALPFTLGYFYKFFLQCFFLNNLNSLVFLPFVVIGMLSSLIYFYRLVYYTLFDIYKGPENVFESYFNINFKNHIKFYSQTTILSTISITFLLVLILFFKFFLFFYFSNFFILEIFDFFIFSNNANFNSFVYLFYIFFSCLIFFLLRTFCREDFFYLEKNYFHFLFFLFIWFFWFFI